FASHPVIENNEVSFNAEHGIYHSNSADYPTIRGNRSHHNSGGGIQLNADYSAKCPCGTTLRHGTISFALLENNVLYENGVSGGSAINWDGVDDSVIRNNLIYDNHAFGISLFSTDGSHGSSRNKVYNTIVMALNGRWAVNIPKSKGSGGSPVGNIVKNNILYTERADKGAIAVYSTAAGVLTSDYNAVVDRFSTNGGTSVTTAGALFANPGGNDYRLATGSPAIDTGTNLSPDVVDDITHTARPQRT